MSNNVKRRLKLWFRPTKKKIILVCVAVALLAAAGAAMTRANKAAKASAASDEEEALYSIHGEGNYVIRLTGQKGHTQMALTLGLLGVEMDRVTISVEGGYNESDISLQYLGDGLVCLIYQQGDVDICKVYQTGKSGLKELISVTVSATENAHGYLQDGQFFLITSQRTMIYDGQTGEAVSIIDQTP